MPERDRRRSRKAALGALYAADIAREPVAAVLTDPPAPLDNFARRLVAGVAEHELELDDWISEVAEHWTVERMPPLDLAILRMALFELRWLPDVPTGATINEAVELAKCYSTTDSSRFVNGLLGRLAERAGRARGEQTEETEAEEREASASGAST